MGSVRERRSNHGEVENQDWAAFKVRKRNSNVCSAAGCDEAKAKNVPRSGVRSSGPETAWSGGFGRGDVRIGGLRGFQKRDLICRMSSATGSLGRAGDARS